MIGSLERIMQHVTHWRETFGANVPIVATSGGFDPLHIGHVRCLREAAELRGERGLLVVIVNDDEFLMKKKGYVFMPLKERMEVIDAIRGVDHVVFWGGEDGTVAGAIETLRPTIFAKGGDRSRPEHVPEVEVCKKVGCAVRFGVGGVDKAQSSSKLVEKERVVVAEKIRLSPPPLNVPPLTDEDAQKFLKACAEADFEGPPEPPKVVST